MQEILPVLKNIFLYMINLLNDDPTKYFALFFGIPVGIMGLLMYGWIIVKYPRLTQLSLRKKRGLGKKE